MAASTETCLGSLTVPLVSSTYSNQGSLPCNISPFQTHKDVFKKLLDHSLTQNLFLKGQLTLLLSFCPQQKKHCCFWMFIPRHILSSDRLRELLLNFSRHLAMVTVTALGSSGIPWRCASCHVLNIVESTCHLSLGNAIRM